MREQKTRILIFTYLLKFSNVQEMRIIPTLLYVIDDKTYLKQFNLQTTSHFLRG